ncbi:MAG: winged helix DNA-binding domain-containing protein [Geodermatophilaceae bacterium]|nr:winged helix DNA-binding domain-containing protein [Geodermatophilaceae bacterium]
MPRIRTLSDRDLTLSFLARQLLLVRRRMPAHVAVRRLGALQAQYSPSPYVALHSRLEGFRTTGLEAAITRGSVIKATLMRGTLHLVHRRDYPAYAAAWHRQAWARPSGAQQGPPEPELAADLVAFSAKPRSTDEIRDRVRRLTGGAVGEADLLNYARMLVPFLHVPPSGLWRRHGKFAVVAYTGGLPAEPTATALVVRRYLAAFGPATRESPTSRPSGFGTSMPDWPRSRRYGGARTSEVGNCSTFRAHPCRCRTRPSRCGYWHGGTRRCSRTATGPGSCRRHTRATSSSAATATSCRPISWTGSLPEPGPTRLPAPTPSSRCDRSVMIRAVSPLGSNPRPCGC